MAEPIGDEENQRKVQGSTPGEVLAILVISFFFACSLVSLVSRASHGANCYCLNYDP